MPNVNCLEGVSCPDPECENESWFYVTASAFFELTDEGTGDHEDVTWGDDANMSCGECGYRGPVGYFRDNASEPESPPPSPSVSRETTGSASVPRYVTPAKANSSKYQPGETVFRVDKWDLHSSSPACWAGDYYLIIDGYGLDSCFLHAECGWVVCDSEGRPREDLTFIERGDGWELVSREPAFSDLARGGAIDDQPEEDDTPDPLPPLRLSIGHWARHALTLRFSASGGMARPGEGVNGNHCALCGTFAEEKHCEGCPVMERTGKEQCGGSPWFGAYAAFGRDGNGNGNFPARARAELDFLVDLLPDAEKRKVVATLGSIDHWRRLSTGTRRDGEHIGPQYCALCKEYSGERGCEGCPVMERMGCDSCYGSPYADASRAESAYGIDSEEFRAAAKAEWKFLVSLLTSYGEED